MKRILPVVLLAALLSGCISRTLTINSEPAGARVFVDHREAGVTPLTLRFTHYGDHDLILLYRGYSPYHGKLTLKSPGWAVFPVDIVTEALLPSKLTDEKEVTITLSRPPVEASDKFAE